MCCCWMSIFPSSFKYIFFLYYRILLSFTWFCHTISLLHLFCIFLSFSQHTLTHTTCYIYRLSIHILWLLLYMCYNACATVSLCFIIFPNILYTILLLTAYKRERSILYEWKYYIIMLFSRRIFSLWLLYYYRYFSCF